MAIKFFIFNSFPVFFMFFLFQGGDALGAQKIISLQDLKVELKMRNIVRLIKTFNDIKRMRSKGEILPFLEDLWADEKEKYPDLPWDIISKEIIKLEISNILLQAYRNGNLKLDESKNEIHEYAKKLVNSSDRNISRRAISNLSVIDDKNDLNLIFNKAKDKKEIIFKASVSALLRSCNQEAKNALTKLEKSIQNLKRKSYIIDKKKSWESFRANLNWCETKH